MRGLIPTLGSPYGVLMKVRTWSTSVAVRSWLPLAVTALLLPAPALALSIDVNCASVKVGEIMVNADGTGISGGFMSVIGGPPPTSLRTRPVASIERGHPGWGSPIDEFLSRDYL